MVTWAVGIDLGTANTRVAVCRNDKTEIIPDEEGSRSMPSYVSFGERQRLIGAAAKRQANQNPENTVFNILRLLGRDFKDSDLQDDLEYLPFKVIDVGKLFIIVRYRGQEMRFTPEEVLAMILSKAKRNAEAYLGSSVTQVFMSVPAIFGSRQYDGVRDAAAIAGLEVMRIIPSPACASYAFPLEITAGKEYICAIPDLGAGSFNVTVMSCEAGVVDMKTIDGDAKLGGEDFLKCLFDYLIAKINREWNTDITNNKRSMQRLRNACQQAIHQLSSADGAEIRLDPLYEGRDFSHRITRHEFESLCGGLSRGIRQTLDRALLKAKNTVKSEVQYVFPLGGCSRIPLVERVLSDYFGNKSPPEKYFDAEECQVRGLAVGASILAGDESNNLLNNTLLLSILPKSIGIETRGGSMFKILPKNVHIPTKRTSLFSLSLTKSPSDTLPEAERRGSHLEGNLPHGLRTLCFYEGENPFVGNNQLIRTFSVDSILPPPGPEEVCLEITLDVSADFRIKVTVTVKEDNGGPKKSTSTSLSHRIPEQLLQEARCAEAVHKAADDTEAQRLLERQRLDSRISSMCEAFHVSTHTTESKPDWQKSIERIRVWTDENELASREEHGAKLRELDRIELSLRNGGAQSMDHSRSEGSAQKDGQGSSTAYPTTPSPHSLMRQMQEMVDWLGQTRDQFETKKRELEASLEALSHFVSGSTSRGARNSYCDPPFTTPTVNSREETGAASATSPYKDVIIGQLFDSLFVQPREPYTTADMEMISAYLKIIGETEHSKSPRLYTALRLIDQLDLFGDFLQRGLSDTSFPLSYRTLPSTLGLEIAHKLIDIQAVVASSQ